MEVFGKVRGFLMTVGAIDKIAEMCPDGEFERLFELFGENVPTAKQLKNAGKLIVIMNEGFEEFMACNDPDYTPDPLTLRQVYALPIDKINKLEEEALKAAVPDSKVETEPNSKKK